MSKHSGVLLLLLTWLMPFTGHAQDLSGLFIFDVSGKGEKTYVTVEPDSMPTDPALRVRCSALWHYHDYLFQIYANAAAKGKEFGSLHPDTEAMKERFKAYLDMDTAFTGMYLRSFGAKRIAPLDIDTALRIASHFYYVHRVDGKPTVHICIGINKVKELGDAWTHPHHAAFCYMAIREMKDHTEPYLKVRDPFRKEVKAGVSDERLGEIEQEIYRRIAALPEMRQALIDTYERKKEHLNFMLVY
jgi:hypothetical protein